MIQEQKLQIREALLRYVSSFPSQALAAQSLEGVNSSMITKLKNYHLDAMNDGAWQMLARQVGFYCGDWHAADTSTYMLLRILFSDAKHYAMVYGIAIEKGLGKTFSAKMYSRENANTYYMACTGGQNRKTFITELVKNFINDVPDKVPEMMQVVCDYMSRQDEPLLIIDDAHKLKDRVLHFVISLTDCLMGLCGVVIMGNDDLRRRMLEGVRQNKEGFETVYKMIGRRFVTLGHVGPNDAELICYANNVKDENRIAFIKEQCKNSLHPIAGLIQDIRLQGNIEESIAA